MPERRTSRVIAGSADPESMFLALERVTEDVFWLDAGADAREGWSFVGTGEPVSDPGAVRMDAALPVQPGEPALQSGWVGWVDYESGARSAGAPAAKDEAPIDTWLRVTRLAAFEHATGRVWAIADDADHEEWAEMIAASAGMLPQDPPVADPRTAVARDTPVEYGVLIERCRSLIRSGIAYQLCLTTRFTVPGAHDAVDAYRRLRAATPAHHGGFVRIGGRALLSASPEQFLHVEGGVVRTRPIKGTRPRNADPQLDAQLALELELDPKERAENVMIVDLMRNDFSRVCDPGSIRVDALWEVESYPAVHQLVSTVSGTVATGTTFDDLLAATFPAGSMTGAPKLSAMTRLHELEAAPRGVYAGCFGYVSDAGAVDLAMVIRSIFVTPDSATVGAGGGITWKSVVDAEIAEVATKARAPLAALGAESPGDWTSDILT